MSRDERGAGEAISPAERLQHAIAHGLRATISHLRHTAADVMHRVHERHGGAGAAARGWLDLVWGNARRELGVGLAAAAVLVPQAVAFAMLAGLSPKAGIFAAVVSLLIYAGFGGSRVLSVGPMAIVAFVTALTLGPLAAPGSGDYAALAMALALLSGLVMLFAGLFRLGLLLNFIARPVAAGIMAALALMIMVAQIAPLLGLSLPATHSIFTMLTTMLAQAGAINPISLLIGLMCVAVLLLRVQVEQKLRWVGVAGDLARNLSHALPLLMMVAASVLVYAFQLDAKFGVRTVAALPVVAVPSLVLPGFDAQILQALLPGALVIALLAMLEGERAARPLEARARRRLVRSRELMAQGAANLGAGLAMGLPVAASAQRSALIARSGGRSRLTAVVTVLFMLAAVGLFAPLSGHLPTAVLAAVIMVAVAPAFDFSPVRDGLRYSRGDVVLFFVAAVLVLVFGVVWGVAAAVLLSVGVYLWHTARPHLIVDGTGNVAGDEEEPAVQGAGEPVPAAWPADVALIRLADNLDFAKAAELERLVLAQLAARPRMRALVLSFAGVHHIHAAACPVLASLFRHARTGGVTVHLSGLRPALRDRLIDNGLLQTLVGGQLFSDLAQAVAVVQGTAETKGGQESALAQAEAAWRALGDRPDAQRLRAFARAHPTHKQARFAMIRARLLEDDAAWQRAERLGTLAAYRSYLRSLAQASGPHVRKGRGRARARMRQLAPVGPQPYLAAGVLLFALLSGLWQMGEALLASSGKGRVTLDEGGKIADRLSRTAENQAAQARLVKENLVRETAARQVEAVTAGPAGDGSAAVVQGKSVSPPASAKERERDRAARRAEEHRRHIAKVQFLLKELGYRVGAVDGRLGKQTQRNIRLFLDNLKKQTTADKLPPAVLEALLAAKLHQEKRWNRWASQLPDVELPKAKPGVGAARAASKRADKTAQPLDLPARKSQIEATGVARR